MLHPARLRRFIFATLCCVIGLVPTACGSGIAAPPKGLSYTQQAASAVQVLQGWYNPQTGLYDSPSGWWNAANAITALINYERVAKDTNYLSVIANTFTAAQAGTSGHPNFTNNYFDDSGWWGLAWIDAYDLTGNPQYLSAAQTIFTYLLTGWDTAACGGGMWWNTNRTYKNAITNELFLSMAAKLANRTIGATSTNYLSWAQKEWGWFKASGMINSQGLINDGLTSSNPAACVNNNGTVWSYNQGVVIGGLVELSQATSDASLIIQAQNIASAAISPSSPLISPTGILIDHGVSGGDAPQFKGIFLRDLMALYAAVPTAQVKTFTQTNANSIWSNDNANLRFGALWQGPPDSADATRQTSALDALIAAAAMQ